ncbi:MAG: creatininase family protein [Actinomycetales bacterium]|nr:creatininase family protein [Actinomycetales bacterium]
MTSPGFLRRRRTIVAVGTAVLVLAVSASAFLVGRATAPGDDPAHPAAAGEPVTYPKDGFFRSYPLLAETIVEMPSPAVDRAAKDGAVVLVPLDPIEEHGPHLGLGPDIYLSAFVARVARAELAGRGTRAVIAPPIYWAVNKETLAWAGSFAVRASTMEALLSDVVGSMGDWGFRRFYVVSSHGDPEHVEKLAAAMKAVAKEHHVSVLQAEVTGELSVPWPGVSSDVHAGAAETSMMAALYPGQVDEATARSLEAQSTFVPLGYYGNPAGFDPQGFEPYLRAVGEGLADMIAADVAGNSTS